MDPHTTDPEKQMIVAREGITDLPPGTIAAIVTYLAMEAPPPPRPVPGGSWSLEPIAGDLARYRALYARVGDDWLWFSRRLLPDAALGAILDDPRVEVWALRDGGDVGLLELDFREEGSCELAFFGLVPGAIGRGAGRALMAEALRRAWARPIERLVVHTCTLDHPSAIAFYIRSGFRPVKRALEIAPDPRLTGHMPRTLAAHCPVIEPD